MSPHNGSERLHKIYYVFYRARRQCTPLPVLDADMMVSGDLRPLFSALDVCMPGALLVCRDQYIGKMHTLGHHLSTSYRGHADDLVKLLGTPRNEANYPLIVNDGLLAGGREAFLALDSLIRAMPEAARWVDELPDHYWRNQFILNLALARLHCGVELDPTYNLQLSIENIDPGTEEHPIQIRWRDRPSAFCTGMAPDEIGIPT